MHNVMQDMMSKLVTKDILYDPMVELREKVNK
jgi:hypothetical protein